MTNDRLCEYIDVQISNQGSSYHSGFVTSYENQPGCQFAYLSDVSSCDWTVQLCLVETHVRRAGGKLVDKAAA